MKTPTIWRKVVQTKRHVFSIALYPRPWTGRKQQFAGEHSPEKGAAGIET
jgi:hypothetical protein